MRVRSLLTGCLVWDLCLAFLGPSKQYRGARQRCIAATVQAEVPREAHNTEHSLQTPTPVCIRLYDIGNGMQPVLSAVLRKPMPHIWHVGVAAFGSEYWFSTKIEVSASSATSEFESDAHR
jgi:hypothetical protein